MDLLLFEVGFLRVKEFIIGYDANASWVIAI